ncbi:MAG: RNA-binding cell elongation regulator Jag/EloR [Lachnospiraceae bacterium]|nr:protein jag [Lachnospiraceae bacterium]MDY5741859.1 RNA-binding cell elongation regulator Jag/EloR [Lachnospiraceae bacterium]
MEKKQFTAKTVEEAITKACIELGIVSSELNYVVLEKESKGFLGIGSKPGVIEVTIDKEKSVEPIKEAEAKIEKPVEKKPIEPKPVIKKTESKAFDEDEQTESITKISKEDYEAGKKAGTEFLQLMLEKMNIKAEVKAEIDEKNRTVAFEVSGDQMGILIGKRGQTLDSIQYLVGLVVNKESNQYLRVKLDTENYRERRKETLENLAKNMANKVKKRGYKVELDPMNPYERRIIHYALQNDRQVKTHSEGNEPYRRIVISLKK